MRWILLGSLVQTCPTWFVAGITTGTRCYLGMVYARISKTTTNRVTGTAVIRGIGMVRVRRFTDGDNVVMTGLTSGRTEVNLTVIKQCQCCKRCRCRVTDIAILRGW